MNDFLKQTIQKLAHLCGYEIIPKFPTDIDIEDLQIIDSVKPFTMTNTERIFSLIKNSS